MLSRLSLRLRIFLFFCLLAVGGAGLAAAALAFGWSRSDTALPMGPFITALILFVFLNTGLTLGIWLLFDENVAKPIARLSAQLRLRAHSGVDSDVDTADAKHLGDLAPAAFALSRTIGNTLTDTAARVASETQRLQSESERLTALLSEIPIATILLNPAQEIVLYDSQAAEILGRIAPPRLKARLSDYFDLSGFAEAASRLSEGSGEASLRLGDASGTHVFDARLRSLGNGDHMILIDVPDTGASRVAPRPLVYNFDFLNPSYPRNIDEAPLSEQCFVAFDTETTGLSVQNDEIVQIGAVRILGGRIVKGEVIDTYVDPGRPIPPASTRIHGVTNENVAGAPDIGTAGRALHDFARDAVLVAHNAPFDIGLLRKSRSRTGADWTHPVLDTVLLSAVVFGTNEEHSLDALCKRLSIEIPEDKRHTALGDAQATAEVLVRLLPLLDGRGITTLKQLLSETRKHGRLLRDMNA
ncbi:3'-5' exonuclease [Rhodobacteraceae bacterium N5(2021)]|uniref:DNA-directed DNA polymerase n=1 Tax=Gymnodinialimonas phycosphaerae TaxID=2841589 RepID=A0A975YHN4_9RHOB|nr:exonuclease domain-containing protein [Gymnodinialimonas phycosphaerae]MBY4892877.1 3'-5' exonuclease [Gymnodinialimonas phycosphaerae]